MTNGEQQHNITFAEFEMDTARRLLRRGGEPLALYAKTFDLLEFLVENNGRTVSKNEILESVWAGQFVEEANLSVQISALRKALGETKNAPRFLITVPGKGYKFVADLETGSGEIVIEKHKVSRITIEQKTGCANEFERRTFDRSDKKSTPALADYRQSAGKRPFGGTRPLRAFALILLGAFSLAALYFYFRPVGAAPSFEKISLTRLTSSGRTAAAAIAPDGKYFAYVLSESEGNSLWIQQVGTASSLRLLPPLKAKFWHLTFSPDGAFIYYNLFYGDKTDNELYRIPSLGGVIEQIPNVIAQAVSFAPDGKHFSFIRPDSAANQNYLVVSSADGTDQKILAAKPHPETFVFDGDFTAWSPDGSVIAAVVNNLKPEENYASIALFNVQDGKETTLSSAPIRHIFDLEWASDGSGLLVSGSDKSLAPPRIWFVPFPNGEARPLTNDLSSYDWIEVAGNGKSLVTRQTNTTNGIYVGEAGGEFREIVSETGVLNPLVWTPDGEIVYRSTAGGTANLWKMDVLGANRRQLTTNAQVDHRGMCATADGRYLVFVSWRSGKSNLWRSDADGKNLFQLTDGEADAYPVCTPDSDTIIYQRGILTQPALWKISVKGGEPARLTAFRAKWAAISPDGRRVSFFQMVEDKWRIKFISPDGKPETHTVDVPANLRESFVRFSPDGKNLFYIGAVGNIANVFALPLAGGEPQPVTSFTSHQIPDFALSPDGKRIAAARTNSLSDIVLMTDETISR